MNKPKLSYSNTNYNTQPPEDINNLLVEDSLLTVVAKEGMKKRLAARDIKAIGVWELTRDFSKLNNYNTIVIIGRSRIHPVYEDRIIELEKYLNDTDNG
jgi:hypothetical protein